MDLSNLTVFILALPILDPFPPLSEKIPDLTMFCFLKLKGERSPGEREKLSKYI